MLRTACANLLLIAALLISSSVFAAATIHVTTETDEFSDPGPDDGCSLREAIRAANIDAAFGGCDAAGGTAFEADGADLILVPDGQYILTLSGTGENATATGDLDILSSMTIQGDGGVPEINGNDDDRVFEVLCIDFEDDTPDEDGFVDCENGADVVLQDLIIRNGDVTDQYADFDDIGGGILVHDVFVNTAEDEVLPVCPLSNLTLHNVTFNFNQACMGGGLAFLGKQLTLEAGDVFQYNQAITPGEEASCSLSAGIPVGGGLAILGLSDTDLELAISDAIVADNDAFDASQGAPLILSAGGGMALVGNITGGRDNDTVLPAQISDITVEHNLAATGGGLLLSQVGTFVGGVPFETLVEDCEPVRQCNVIIVIDQIYSAPFVNISDASIIRNEAFSNAGGAGILSFLSELSVTSSTLARNMTFGTGGGIAASAVPGLDPEECDGLVEMTNVTITENVADEGGGITGPEQAAVAIQNSIVAGNIVSNPSSETADCTDVISVSHNIIGDSTGCGITQDNPATDLLDTDPLLGIFTDTGLPGGQHFPLTLDSPAVDTADDAVCHGPFDDDQIDNPFVDIPDKGDMGVICDRGAIELQAVCGNDLVETGEECDDGNPLGTPVDNLDECRSDCLFNVCGDGFVNVGVEECEDGRSCDDGSDCTKDPSVCGDDSCAPRSGDGCSEFCEQEPGFENVCGDAIIVPADGEECDDGNTVDGDGCDANCLLEGSIVLCGNGILDAGEFCDPSVPGTNPADCDIDCTAPECGDRLLNKAAGEECEDGNTENGDGCSAECKNELKTALENLGGCIGGGGCIFGACTESDENIDLSNIDLTALSIYSARTLQTSRSNTYVLLFFFMTVGVIAAVRSRLVYRRKSG